jgi:hypothetical protein
MVDAVRHTLRFQDQRTSKNLNAHTKDLFGRHRGHVLYGMQASLTGLNTVQIGAGAIYTPLGTHFYWDVFSQPTVASIDLSTKVNLASLSAADRPVVLALVAEVSLASPSTPFALESTAQVSAQTIQFNARVVSVSRATGQPTLNLAPLSPVDLNVAQPLTGGTHYVHTWDTTEPTGAAVKPPASETAEIGSLKNNEVLLGYIVIGSPEANAAGAAPLSTTYGVGSGPYTWAPGIVYVPALNPHEAVADLLGLDPMLGRVADRVVSGRGPGGAGNRAFTQATTADRLGDSGAFNDAAFAEAAPKFGSTAPTASATSPWASTWSTYRWPSFLRDGDSFLMALKRMDYVLRLWMNRTGDQALVKLTQDTRIDNDGTAGPLNYQSTLAQLLRHFDGTKVAASGLSKNSNAMGWGTVTAPVTDVTADGHVLIDGVVTHDPATAGAGDSHFTAIQGLDAAIFHVLKDVIGFGATNRAFPTKADLRDAGTLDAGIRTHFADGPLSNLNRGDNTTVAAARGTFAGAALSPYLNQESIYDTLALLAHRALQGPSENWLRDPTFSSTGLTNTAISTAWGTSGLTLTQKAGYNSSVAYLTSQLTGTTASLAQTVDVPALSSVVKPGGLLSFALDVSLGDGSQTALLRIELFSGGTVLGTAQSPLNTMASMGSSDPQRISVSTTPSTAAAITSVRFTLVVTGNVSTYFSVAGAWAGAGVPGGANYSGKTYDFLSRDGGSANVMRGPLHLPSSLTNDLTADGARAPRSDQALTVAGAIPESDYDAAGMKITNGAPGVAGTDFAIVSQLATVLPWVSAEGNFTLNTTDSSPQRTGVFASTLLTSDVSNATTRTITLTAPCDMLLSAYAVGGGGGGGSSGDQNSDGGGGGGGAGGGVGVYRIRVYLGQTITCIIGKGGAPGSSGANSNGSPGSQGTFTEIQIDGSPIAIGIGGNGGQGGIRNTNGAGGAGGTATGGSPVAIYGTPGSHGAAAPGNGYGAGGAGGHSPAFGFGLAFLDAAGGAGSGYGYGGSTGSPGTGGYIVLAAGLLSVIPPA